MSASEQVALIIGHRGQDGTLLRGLLEKEGAKVIGVGRPTGKPGSSRELVDIRDCAAIEALVSSARPSAIYYLAAHHGSSESMPIEGGASNSRTSWETHVAGFENTLAAARKLDRPTPVVLASSSLVFEASAGRIDESSTLAPDSVYGLTKAAAVLLAREGQRSGQLVHILHLFPHESGLRNEAFIASKIVRTGLRIAAGSPELLLIGDPVAEVDWSLAREVVRVMREVARMHEPQELVVGSGRESSVFELADTVFRGLDLEVDRYIETDPSLLERPAARRIANASRLSLLLPWWRPPDLTSFASSLVQEHLHCLATSRH